MKKLRLSIAYLAMIAMIFTSCSKEETGANLDPETATLSFGAMVSDLMDSRAASKQSVGDIPECSDDTPAYVSIVLSRDGVDVVGSDDDPFEIGLVAGQIFTEEVAELQLDPDTYSLEHFAVYNDDDEVIWIAPRAGSELGGWINNPLPLSIELGAGVKKYVEVPVLCFDNRDVNEYGYLFFELDETEAVKFCFFANYCPPNSGDRHYTASYSVTIWSGTTATGTPLYNSVENTTGQYNNGDYFADPLCFALPANDDMDEEYLYYEVTLLDWPGNYTTVAPNTVISGTLSMDDITANFDGPNNVDYEHLRFGCGDDTPAPGGDCPGDRDCDGTPDDDDNCPDEAGTADNDGCPLDDCTTDTDGDGVVDCDDTCPDEAGTEDNYGCPLDDCTTDTDGDGVVDCDDSCPDEQGTEANGCPGDDNGGDTCETAFMFGDTPINTLSNSNRWGWAEHYQVSDDGSSTTFDLWAGAGRNDTSRAELVGSVLVSVDGDDINVDITLASGVSLEELHLNLSQNAPSSNVARAPGQYNMNDTVDAGTLSYTFTRDYSEDFYIIVHAVSCY